jgi:hypothetical protein
MSAAALLLALAFQGAAEGQARRNAAVTGRDIVRDSLRLKLVRRPIGSGRSCLPCRLVRRSVVGTGGAGGRVVRGGYTRPCELRADDRIRDPQAAGGGRKARCGWSRTSDR